MSAFKSPRARQLAFWDNIIFKGMTFVLIDVTTIQMFGNFCLAILMLNFALEAPKSAFVTAIHLSYAVLLTLIISVTTLAIVYTCVAAILFESANLFYNFFSKYLSLIYELFII